MVNELEHKKWEEVNVNMQGLEHGITFSVLIMGMMWAHFTKL